MDEVMNKVKLFFQGLGEALKDEFGISGAKKLSKPSILKYDMFMGVYIKGNKTIDQLNAEERDCLRSELIERMGVDDFELYKSLWLKYVQSIQGNWGTSSLPTVGGFERWLRQRISELKG
jgi:hypothetical protein